MESSMMKKQQGMTLTGWMVVVALILFFACLE